MKYLSILLFVFVSVNATAGVISYESTIYAKYGATIDDSFVTVDYISFSVLDAGSFTFTTYSFDYDPVFFLLSDDGSLDSNDIIAYNDMGVPGDPWLHYAPIITNYLDVGDYILAVSESGFGTGEVLSGINGIYQASDVYYNGIGTLDVYITSDDGIAQVNLDEPASLALILAGIFPMLVRRRKDQLARNS